MITVAGERCSVGSAAAAAHPTRDIVRDPNILVRRHVRQVPLQHIQRGRHHLVRRQPRIDAAHLQRLVQPLDMLFQLERPMPETCASIPSSCRPASPRYRRPRSSPHPAAASPRSGRPDVCSRRVAFLRCSPLRTCEGHSLFAKIPQRRSNVMLVANCFRLL